MSEQTAIEAMRDALASALRNFDAMGQAALAGEINTDAVAMLCASMSAKISAALAAPPRNCDVGTPTEQARRFQLFCQQHRDIDAECSTMCPFVDTADINHCQSGWAQLPYKERGAE